jgi:formylmethanofuran dehydrogenase subunit C
MNKQATIRIKGSAGPGVAENMMSGTVIIAGDASQDAGATGRGGLLVIKGNASSRCGISMKGIDIVVHGNIAHMSCFMAQSGNMVVLGNAGEALGDSLYEARLFVRHLGLGDFIHLRRRKPAGDDMQGSNRDARGCRNPLVNGLDFLVRVIHRVKPNCFPAAPRSRRKLRDPITREG